MITGHIKNQIDQIWDTFWTGGISNSIDILEQMTYLFFMKLLDDKQLNQEATATIIGQKVSNPTFGGGLCLQTVSQDVFSLLSQN